MRSLAQILRTTRALWPAYWGIVACSLLVAATSLATPFIIKAATDTVVSAATGHSSADDAARRAVLLAGALLLAELADTFVTNVGGYLGDTTAARLRAILSTRYYEKLLSLPQRYFDDEVTGTVISRLTRSITTVTDFLQTFSNTFFPMLMTLVAVLGISAWYYWPLALLLVVVFPLYTWLTALTSTRWQRLEGLKNAEVDAAGGRFAEVVGQVRVVKSFVAERRELDSFTQRYDQTVVITRRQSRWWHLMDVARRSALNVIFFVVYALIFVRTVQGRLGVGDMVLLVQLVTMARMPVQMMSYLVDTSQRAVAGSTDYCRVLAEPTDDEEASLLHQGAATASVVAGCEVRFEHVTFGYEDGGEVVRDVSFTVPQGARVALVSESGGGKTTLVSLLLGLYRPQLGRIVVGGRDARDIPLDELRRSVGVVFQDASLFSGTIRENIAYGRPGATDAAVEDAARRANAHEFIARFPDGYDQIIGERGLKLSGGQKQRVAVARAILKDAPVLVLDEATSALDSKAERAVQAGLEELMAGRTTLVIAHRLATISTVDTIVTLRGGRVDEVGSPVDLATSGGIYSELLALQAGGSKRDRRRLREFDITA